MSNVLLIGAGNIGSRHLQGLAKVKKSLNIQVLDPSKESLKISEERFKQIPRYQYHKISFHQNFNQILNNNDIAIIATSSNIRRKVTEELLGKSNVKNIIFEKLLFQKKEDYIFINKLLKKKMINAWVNCSMRVTPFYQKLKTDFAGKKIVYLLTGTRFGIATQAIHFIDHMAYLLDSYDFEVDTSLLDRDILKSKRAGFLELTGTLKVNFKDGNVGIFADFKNGDAPIIAEIYCDSLKAIANESTRETFISQSPKWQLKSAKNKLLFQSDMTNKVVEDILKNKECGLPTYQQSETIHLKLLEGLLKFINQNSKTKYDFYPFT